MGRLITSLGQLGRGMCALPVEIPKSFMVSIGHPPRKDGANAVEGVKDANAASSEVAVDIKFGGGETSKEAASASASVSAPGAKGSAVGPKAAVKTAEASSTTASAGEMTGKGGAGGVGGGGSGGGGQGNKKRKKGGKK